ncbi:hypothetical protein [Halorubrum trueperi]|uniref:DUF8147 domain-containing protein n=1 Tax=Halorubrum trueperi TaxID=2004704 RepID=A0ABD5UUB5_9EURY
MNGRMVATVGSAVTTFLLVSAVLTELLAARIEFSALVGLPVGIVVGGAVGLATWIRLWRDPAARPALLGWSAIGYALIVAAAVSYAVPSARGFVGVATAVPFAGLCGAAAFWLTRRYPELVSE